MHGIAFWSAQKLKFRIIFSPIAYFLQEFGEYKRMMKVNCKRLFFLTKKPSNLEAHNCVTKFIAMCEGALSVIATEM